MHDTVVLRISLTTAKTHTSDNMLWARTGVCYACVDVKLIIVFQVRYFPVLHFPPRHSWSCIFQYCIFGLDLQE